MYSVKENSERIFKIHRKRPAQESFFFKIKLQAYSQELQQKRNSSTGIFNMFQKGFPAEHPRASASVYCLSRPFSHLLRTLFWKQVTHLNAIEVYVFSGTELSHKFRQVKIHLFLLMTQTKPSQQLESASIFGSGNLKTASWMMFQLARNLNQNFKVVFFSYKTYCLHLKG